MTVTHVAWHTAVEAPSSVDIQRRTQRAGLRSCTQSLIRELTERYDHAVDLDAPVLVAERIRHLRAELVAAMREDVAAIESLCAKTYGRGTTPSASAWAPR